MLESMMDLLTMMVQLCYCVQLFYHNFTTLMHIYITSLYNYIILTYYIIHTPFYTGTSYIYNRLYITYQSILTIYGFLIDIQHTRLWGDWDLTQKACLFGLRYRDLQQVQCWRPDGENPDCRGLMDLQLETAGLNGPRRASGLQFHILYLKCRIWIWDKCSIFLKHWKRYFLILYKFFDYLILYVQEVVTHLLQ